MPARYSPPWRDSPGGRRSRESLLAYAFLAPTLAGVAIFTVGPIVASILLSFYEWDILSPPKFVGIDNYRSIANDPLIASSLLNTIRFVCLAVMLQLGVSLALALALRTRLPRFLNSIFRSAFFLPVVTSAASISIVMTYLFNDKFGPVNYYLAKLGVDGIPWLTSGGWAMLAVVFAYVWQQFGLTFLIFVGGLAAIPADVYEAAAVDGSAGWRTLRYITLPLLSPTILIASVISIIHAMQVFDQPYVMTRGGPGDATTTMVLTIYRFAFENLQFGRASAVSVFLLAMIATVTALQFRLSRNLVFYQ